MSIITATVNFQSDKEITDVGKILSSSLFAGLKFEGLEDNIYEEIPAIYIKQPLFNSKVIISGFKGYGEEDWYSLTIEPWLIPNDFNERERKNITGYLESILNGTFKVLSE